MKNINVIIRGNLICSGNITPTPDGDVSAFCCPADVVLPKIFRHGETIYDITNAVVINADEQRYITGNWRRTRDRQRYDVQ